MSIRNSVVFDIAGSLTTSGGFLANFIRGSKAYSEYLIDGGISLVEVSTHQPRFGNDGSLYLETGGTNYVRRATDLSNTQIWPRGSHITVLSNTSTSMSNTYAADRVTVTPGTGNIGRQTLRQDLFVPGGPVTFTFYLRLMGGTFGPQDKMRITGAIDGGTVEVSLADVYNNNPRRYLPISVSTAVMGNSGQVSMQLYIENTVSFDFAGASASPGLYRTSFIDGLTEAPSRANESLAYEKSPFEGLQNFCFYFSILEWRGAGKLFDAGNISASITNTGNLSVQVGSSIVFSTLPIPSAQETKIVLRLNRADNSLKLYINGTLDSQATVNNFVGARSHFDLTPTGVRRYRFMFVLDRALTDGSPAVGSSAGEEVADLITSDSLLIRQTDGRGIITFPSISIKPRSRAAIRLPQTQYAMGDVTQLDIKEDSTPQISVVSVAVIPNASQAQIVWVSINGNPPVYVEVPNPTEERILQALEEALNPPDKTYPVTVAMTELGLMFTADVPGNSFTLAASPTLLVETMQSNVPPLSSLWVSSPADFKLGPARIIRENADIADVVIQDINEVTGELKFTCQPIRLAAAIRVGDTLFQADWRTNIAPGNYLVGIHETHLNEVKVSDKAIDGFALENESTRELVVTPFVRVVV